MEAEGLVNRTAYTTVPPTVEYAMTEKGKALRRVISELKNGPISFYKAVRWCSSAGELYDLHGLVHRQFPEFNDYFLA